MRGTTVPAVTVATSLIRLSALGTAQFCNAPMNGDIVTPLPLPNELVPPVAVAAPAVAVVDDVVAVFVVAAILCGLIGAAIGTVAVAPELLDPPPELPALVLEPAVDVTPPPLPAGLPPEVP